MNQYIVIGNITELVYKDDSRESKPRTYSKVLSFCQAENYAEAEALIDKRISKDGSRVYISKINIYEVNSAKNSKVTWLNGYKVCNNVLHVSYSDFYNDFVQKFDGNLLEYFNSKDLLIEIDFSNDQDCSPEDIINALEITEDWGVTCKRRFINTSPEQSKALKVYELEREL